MSELQMAEEAAETGAPANTDPAELPAAIQFSEMLRRFVDRIGRAGSWLIVPLVLITVMDVLVRKAKFGGFSLQLWLTENVSIFFDSTKLQELEWHLHTGLFALVLGYGYIWNSHVRVDLVREHLAFRKKAWMEFIGLTFFLIPYTGIVIWFAVVFAYDSFMVNEVSASLVGLGQRWMIKSVLVAGLVLAAVAGIAVWLQVVIALWGPQNIRFNLMTLEWPEEEGTKIEGKERLDLSKAKDELIVRAKSSGHMKPASEAGD